MLQAYSTALLDSRTVARRVDARHRADLLVTALADAFPHRLLLDQLQPLQLDAKA